MIWTIAKKELMENILSFRYTITFLLCIILAFLSSWILVSDYSKRLSDYEMNLAERREGIENADSMPQLIDEWSRLYRKPEALSIFVKGTEGEQEKVINISGEKVANPLFSAFGVLDLHLIIKIVMSLMAILFSYDVISGEKERGTLKMILSNPIPRDTVLLGKYLGGLVSLLLPLGISFFLSILNIIVMPSVSLTAGEWLRLLLILLSSALYISVFFALGIFISSRTTISSVTLVGLLFFWLIFVFIIPSLTPLLTAKICRVPPQSEIRKRLDKVWVAARMRGHEYRSWKGRRQVRPQEVEEEKRRRAEWQRIREQAAENRKKITEDYKSQLFKQASLAGYLSRVSPAGSFSSLLTNLANTDVDSHLRFIEYAEKYRRSVGRSSWQIMRARDDFTTEEELIEKAKKQLPKPNPLAPRSIGETLKESLTDIVLLILFNIVFFMGAYLSFLRYDVT